MNENAYIGIGLCVGTLVGIVIGSLLGHLLGKLKKKPLFVSVPNAEKASGWLKDNKDWLAYKTRVAVVAYCVDDANAVVSEFADYRGLKADEHDRLSCQNHLTLGAFSVALPRDVAAFGADVVLVVRHNVDWEELNPLEKACS